MTHYIRGTRVLDVGCTYIPNAFLANYKSVWKIGFDKVELRPEDYQIYDEFIKGDVNHLEDTLQEYDPFDTVLLGCLIEHVLDPLDTLRQVGNLLKPGGRIVLSTPNPVSFPQVFFEWFRTQSFFYSARHIYEFTPRWMCRLLLIAGYVIEDVKGVGLWALPIPFPAGLSHYVVYVASKSS